MNHVPQTLHAPFAEQNRLAVPIPGYVGPGVARVDGRVGRRDRAAGDGDVGIRAPASGCSTPAVDRGWTPPPSCHSWAARAPVIGVDRDPRVIDAARAHGRAGAGAHPFHLVADGARLPFADGWFDACRCERVLQHVADPAAMLSELVRVTRPGGTVLALDTDWASLSIDCQDVALEAAHHAAGCDTFASGYAGRQLPRLMREQPG